MLNAIKNNSLMDPFIITDTGVDYRQMRLLNGSFIIIIIVV